MVDENDGVDAYQLKVGIIVAYHSDRGGLEYKRPRIKEPLDEYFKRRLISQDQHIAGRKLKRIYDSSQHLHKPGQNSYNEYSSNGVSNFERKFIISEELMKAFAAIHGHMPKEVARKVVCYGEKAGKRGGMNHLVGALDNLVRHFGI